MASRWQFCRILPASQVALACRLAGLGSVAKESSSKPRLFVRNRVEQHSQIPCLALKIAAISNFPALSAGLLLTIPIGAVRPRLSEALQLAPTLIFVFLLWLWIGARLDRRWSVADPTPWIAISLFMVLSSIGAFLPLGYTGYLPYGFVVWVAAFLALSRSTPRFLGST